MSKPGVDPSCGISSEDVLIPTERHPACRRREARPGSGTERENLAGDAKGKGASGSNREAESTDAPERGGLPRSSDEAACNGRWSEGGGSSPLIWANWFAGRSPSFSGRRQPSRGGTSRMMREYQVRICERLGVKFPGPTRHATDLAAQKSDFRSSPASGLNALPLAPTHAACLRRSVPYHPMRIGQRAADMPITVRKNERRP